MAIKIKNQSTGKLIIVKNQDDMFNLKNTASTTGFTDPKQKPKDSAFDLDSYDKEDREDYINRFSFDKNATNDTSKDTPLNPTTDPYFDFGDGSDSKEVGQNDDFDINDPTGLDLDDDSEFSFDDMGGASDDSEESGEETNPDFQGDIRSVTGANLVYKRQTQDGSYEELWIYTIRKDAQAEYAIRKAILSGTDIDPNTQQSDDGSQRARTITVGKGNVQYVNITGLQQ